MADLGAEMAKRHSIRPEFLVPLVDAVAVIVIVLPVAVVVRPISGSSASSGQCGVDVS